MVEDAQMKPFPHFIMASAILIACGGETAKTNVLTTDAGSEAAAPRPRQVDMSLVRGPCSELARCPDGQICVRLNRIDDNFQDPVCVATTEPCRAALCEEGRRCSFGEEVPYPLFCDP
jgi:hypothetical protein